MRFEDIADELSRQEGRRVSVHAVRTMYYKALNKLKAKVNNDSELSEMLQELIREEAPYQSEVNEILDSMVKYDNE